MTVKVKLEGTFEDIGGGSAAVEDWVRPADWLPMPAVVEGEQKFVGLVAVFPGDNNWVSVTIAGACTIDWGDGSAAQNVASGVNTQKNYTYAFVANDTTRGYRQAVVTITPQAGSNLTSVNLNGTRPTGLASGYSSPWLDIRMAGANVTTLTVSATATKAAMLERFEFVGPSNITSTTPSFNSASRLQKIVGTEWTAGVTNFSSMFSGCSSLRTIPLLNTAAGTAFVSMFNLCSSLQTIPPIDTTAGTTFFGMFTDCVSLQTIPALNTAAGLSFGGMFSRCTALQIIPALNTAAGTDFASMFNACPSLQVGALTGTTRAISYASCKLSAAQLDAIYTGLGTAAGAQTITVTGNIGVAGDTPAIATAKGWTVSG